MVDFTSISLALQGEVMVDIANGFFGARKAIDDECELFEFIEGDIRLAEQRALNTCAQLKALLTSENDVKELLRAIGVPTEFIDRVDFPDPWLSMELPFAFTAEGRYKKCVLETYKRMCNAFEYFLHGMTYEKKDTAEKYGRTTGYYRYMEWCDDLNTRIKKVNRDRSPSQVLSVVRGMDVEKIAKQRAVGAVTSKAGCIPGDDLCMLLVPCEEFVEMELPELPLPEVRLQNEQTIATLVKRYASEVYKRDRKKVDSILEILKKN